MDKDQITDFQTLKSEGPNSILRFNYYKELAQESALYENSFLANMYDALDYIEDNSVLYKFLSQKNHEVNNPNNKYIYPFGLNLSQKQAVENAFKKDISFIEGPPGTGKTQTILNIIANAVVRNETVAVVSNNNAAIENVRDKLIEYNLDFLLALLGNVENKAVFFDETVHKDKPLEFLKESSRFDLSKLSTTIAYLQDELPNLYEAENRLAKLREKLSAYQKEYEYFKADYQFDYESDDLLRFKKIRQSTQALTLKAQLEHKNTLSWIKKVLLRLKHGVRVKELSNETLPDIFLKLDEIYYRLKIKEMDDEMEELNNHLSKGGFEENKEKYQKVSVDYLKNILYRRYSKMDLVEYSYDNYRSKFDSFMNEYPIVLSTSYALIPSADKGYMFDYLIIDEASQTDLLSSIPAMSCAKNMIVVGDTKQLPQIDNKSLRNVNEELKKHYLITPEYDYFNNNILTSAMAVFKSAPRVLLKEHYRCHPDIINFCNQKFYNNELIILTEEDRHESPLMIYKTVAGNHARKNPNGSGLYNQREIDEIIDIVKDLTTKSVGVITPYRYQADMLMHKLTSINPDIETNTVHKFQGRAKDVIILSTVANDINVLNSSEDHKENFVSRSDLLNVAISRAKKQLRLVVSDKVFNSKNNSIADLIKYIRYHSSENSIKYGKVKSVFDIFYSDYQNEYEKFRSKHNKQGYATEQMVNQVIEKVLVKINNTSLRTFMHYPLRLLATKTEGLNQRERDYVKHIWAHVDFVIVNTLTKEPVLVIEVDGISFHEQDLKQSERDKIKDSALRLNNIPLLRLKTNESREEERIYDALKISISQ